MVSFFMMEQTVWVKCLIVTKNTVQFYASMDFPNMSYPFAQLLDIDLQKLHINLLPFEVLIHFSLKSDTLILNNHFSKCLFTFCMTRSISVLSKVS